MRSLLQIGACAFVFASGAACGIDQRVPVFRVEKGTFVHKVTSAGTLKAKETTKILVPQTVRGRVRVAWLAREGSLVEKGEVLVRFDSKVLEENLEDSIADFEATRFKIERSRAEAGVKIGGHRRDLEVAGLDLEFARRYQKRDREVFTQREIVESKIEEALAEARQVHAQDMTEIQRALSDSELALLGIKSRSAGMNVEEANEGLENLEIRAPHRGVFTLSRNWRGEAPDLGSEMWRGQEVGQMPSLEELEAEVFVLEADAGGLAKGQVARMIVESRPEMTIWARVKGLDARAKPRVSGSPVQYFGVVLQLEKGDTESLKPGQRVVATLFLERMEDVLVVPRQAVFRREEAFWVYIRSKGGFRSSRVQVESSSAGLMVISAGLSDGDVIALIGPDEMAQLRVVDGGST